MVKLLIFIKKQYNFEGIESKDRIINTYKLMLEFRVPVNYILV